MSPVIRRLNAQTDFPRIAELRNTAYPQPVTAEQLAEWERRFPKDGARQRNVALDSTGNILGYNDAGRWPYMPPGKFWIDVIVDPGHRCHGIGALLYQDALEFAQAQRAVVLECEVRDHNLDWKRFAETRGFRVDRHVFESALGIGHFDETRFGNLVKAVQARGFHFFSMADVPDTEENRRKLYELNKTNALDTPGTDGTFAPFSLFAERIFIASWYRPEGQIIAADGDRWVGMTAVGHFPETDSAYTMHTGVLKEYRGRQIALALKILSVRLARQWGVASMRTNNDSQNAPILAVNRKLGYRPEPGYYRMKMRI